VFAFGRAALTTAYSNGVHGRFAQQFVEIIFFHGLLLAYVVVNAQIGTIFHVGAAL
jgi:hypothetical protein